MPPSVSRITINLTGECNLVFQVILYDYAAPDATTPYFVAQQIEARTYREACIEANDAVEERCYVGAKVLNTEGKDVYSVGLTLEQSPSQ